MEGGELLDIRIEELRTSEAVAGVAFSKKLFLKISQISKENTCLESLFINFFPGQYCNFIKKVLQYRFFPVKFAKFLTTRILKNIYEQLLLEHVNKQKTGIAVQLSKNK